MPSNPTPDSRKIISLALLSQFKTDYDAYVAGIVAGLVPYTGANQNVDLGNNNFTVHGLTIKQSANDVLSIEGEFTQSSRIDISAKAAANASSGGSYGISFSTSSGTYYVPGTPGATESGSSHILATLGDVSTVYKYMGSKTFQQINGHAQGEPEIPGEITTWNVGDTYNVTNSGELNYGPKVLRDGQWVREKVKVIPGDNVTWVEAPNPDQSSSTQTYGYWDKLAGTVDLSNYYTMGQVNTLLEGYLPLAGNSGTPMTGILVVKAGAAGAGDSASIKTTDGDMYLDSYGSVIVNYGAGTEQNPGAFKIRGGGSYTAGFSVANLQSSIIFKLPNQVQCDDEVIITGVYASTNDIDGLFSN